MGNLTEEINRNKELMGIINEGPENALHNSCMGMILDKKDHQTFRGMHGSGHKGGGTAGASGIGECGEYLYELMTDTQYATTPPTLDVIKGSGFGDNDQRCGRLSTKTRDSEWQELILDRWGCWVQCIKEVDSGISKQKLTDFTNIPCGKASTEGEQYLTSTT